MFWHIFMLSSFCCSLSSSLFLLHIYLEKLTVRKILVSIKFVSAILGPEMAAPILWAPRISAFFLQENLHVHKIPRFRGGVFWVWGGGVPILFGRGDFSETGLKSAWHMSGGGNLFPKFMPVLFSGAEIYSRNSCQSCFQARVSFLRFSGREFKEMLSIPYLVLQA